MAGKRAFAETSASALNVARVAVPSSRSLMSENKISALNDGFAPADSFDRSHALYAMWVDQSAGERESWVQYEWSEPVSINKVEIYWAVGPSSSGRYSRAARGQDAGSQKLSNSLLERKRFAPVSKPAGPWESIWTRFNTTTFEPVKTSKLRLEVVPQDQRPAGILEWRVLNHGPAPALPPIVEAGVDRSVVSDGKTYLSGKVSWLQDSPRNRATWKKASGPGTVAFAAASAPVTTATFSQPGDYVLELDASGGNGKPRPINVHVEPAPPADRLDVVYTRKYSIDSPLWNARAKALIVDWIPHCIAMCERTDIAPSAARAASTTSSKPRKPIAASRTASTRDMCSPTPGCTRPWSRCASR